MDLPTAGVDAGINPERDGALGDDAGPDSVGHAARYPSDRTQSPITPFVAERIRSMAGASRDPAVFAKVGDSITVSNQFMYCFANQPDSINGDIDQTVALFASGSPASFERESIAAGVGWSSGMVLAGTPSPLEREIEAGNASIAVVMYGTNDAEGGNLDTFGSNLLGIVDTLIAAGVVPVLSSIPPRDYNANDVRVPFYNDMVRALAEARQIPLVDFHREAALLPGFGLGGDGLHPRGSGGGCDFSSQGLQAGYNTRNRITIEAIDRVRRILDSSQAEFDTEAPGWLGQGSKAEPIQVDLAALPFTHSADTSVSTERHNQVYACSPANEGGAEVWYLLHSEQATRVRINIADRGDVDVDLHVLAGAVDASACTARDDRSLDVDLAAGDNYLVVDTYVSGGIELAGEYLLTIRAL